MNKQIFLSAYLIVNAVLCGGSDIFHLKSKITFHPERVSTYFGYSVVLTNSSLLVGAPKAVGDTNKSSGLVFTCKLNNFNLLNVTCLDYTKAFKKSQRYNESIKDDMWFGASIAVTPQNKIMICAPRWTIPYGNSHYLELGTCFFNVDNRVDVLSPLRVLKCLAHQSNGKRKEYGEYGIHLNYYAYGQAGMSLKVTENNSIIIGAPGLMQWTGGIIDYKFSNSNTLYTMKQPISNTYFTNDLGPDDYFGYSVESGIFEVNGTILYVAGAPRSEVGYGKVLIFEPPTQEQYPLNIRAKVSGPQLGSYFGATLCCTDLNGDGRSDLLVGAPNFISEGSEVPYDEGAVFVYLAGGEGSMLFLEEAGYVSGLRESGARFGTAIAALGDIDGDGYGDVAIGAPWENDGLGAVYIYRGSEKGLRSEYAQRIVAEDARGFGISISKGVDVDGNHCNDLAIGAHESATAYLYFGVPTIQVKAYIQVENALNLPRNATNFTAQFCVHVMMQKKLPQIKFDLIASITVDPENKRASVADSEYTINVQPGYNECNNRDVEVNPAANLTEPFLLYFKIKLKKPFVDDSATFNRDALRLSENSTPNTTFLIRLIRDCGEDLICTPLLKMTLEPYNSKYIPGTNSTLGAKLTVLNEEEPSYAAKVFITLPLPPLRVPRDCILEGLNMTCHVPSPLERDASVTWDIELECALKIVEEKVLEIKAELKHPLYKKNTGEDLASDVKISVVPMANFSASGKVLPNATITVTREKYYEADNVTFVHYFEIANYGPSYWPKLEAAIVIPENVTLSNTVKGCFYSKSNLTCSWEMPAGESLSLSLSFKYDLAKYGEFLEQRVAFNETTTLYLLSEERQEISLTTQIVLAPVPPIWPPILGSVVGLLLLAAIVSALYKYGFFSRKDRDKIKLLQEERSSSEEPGCSSAPTIDNSSLELLNDDSDLEGL